MRHRVSALVLSLVSLALADELPAQGAPRPARPVAPARPPHTAPAAAPTPVVEPGLFDGMRWRMVGPHRGGRATAVTGIAERPNVFYMGTTGGGVWRTDDAGNSWTPLTDAFLDNGNVGAIDVADSDPNIIYVGLGSASIRGNVSVGTGVWRSVNGGATWTYLGLPESGAIGKLVIHPTNPNIVFVAALGHPFGKNRERGVYRTIDGGNSWEQVLFLNDSTGAATISMAPDNPNELWAGMWRGERKPWTIISGGPEGGVYRSRDGGATWSKVRGGLPEGIVGKVGITQSPADPTRIWALIEAELDGGLYRSDDRGESWTRVNAEATVRARPFYYTHVRADPQDRDRVYVLTQAMLRSTDGGATFRPVPVPHGDVHDIWINPRDNTVFAISDDGGTVVTVNGGRTFSSMYNQPTAELYDVLVDEQYPYRIYGSQQDNTAISVLHRRLGNSLRPQQEWNYAAGCETGPVAVHPRRPHIVYGGCYGGLLSRYDLRTDTRTSIHAFPAPTNVAPAALADRWQWVAPVVVSPQDTLTLYRASQYLYRSRDEGTTWARISPDLTRNDTTYQRMPGGPIAPDNTGVEIFGTIFAVTPSPHAAGTIWVGTDDGRVHLTRNDGATWSDITPRAMPLRGTVNRIEVSAHAPGRAFLAVQRYRENDQAPYIFRTTDFGRTWTRIADGRNGIPARHWVRVVREDPVVQGLLYAGTEFGMYVSFNDGGSWQSLQMNLPASPVTDAKVHRGDLVISTQGRSFWVLDDLTPLRELARQRTVNVAQLYMPRPAARGSIGVPLREVDLTLPDDLPSGALLHFTLTKNVGALTIDILDAQGAVVRSWRGDSSVTTSGTRSLRARRGFQRVVWDLRGPGPRGGGQGVKMPIGRYTVRLTADSVTMERPLDIVANPTAGFSEADYDAQYALATAVRDTISAINDALVRIRALPDSTRAELAEIEGLLSGPRTPTASPTAAPPPPRLLAYYSSLYGALVTDGGYGSGSAEGRPLPQLYERKAELDAQWEVIRRRLAAAMPAP